MWFKILKLLKRRVHHLSWRHSKCSIAAYWDYLYGKLVIFKSGFSKQKSNGIPKTKLAQYKMLAWVVVRCGNWNFDKWCKNKKNCSKITICMNVLCFLNLATIFSFDLESQYNQYNLQTLKHLKCRLKLSQCVIHIVYHILGVFITRSVPNLQSV